MHGVQASYDRWPALHRQLFVRCLGRGGGKTTHAKKTHPKGAKSDLFVGDARWPHTCVYTGARPRALSAAGPLIPFTCLYVVSVWVVSALRLRGRVFTEWALDRV